MNTRDSDDQILDFVGDITRDVGAVQAGILEQILAKNANVEYFKRHGLCGVPSRDDFKRAMPLSSYTDIESDITRMASGDDSRILTDAPVRQMLTSSGTSGGKQKLFPKSETYDIESVLMNRISRACLNKQIPIQGKSLQFIYVRKPGVTPGGVVTCSGLSGYFTSPAFLNRKIDPSSGFTSPDQVLLCVDFDQSSYAHLLCGLVQSTQVAVLGAPFASTLVRSMKRLSDCWRDLCQDIRSGKANSNIISDLSVKHAVNALLRTPNPELADAIERECSKKNWRGIITRLFPNARVIQTIITGSMQQYVPVIDFLSGELPIASPLYASSECSSLGVNLSPLSPPSPILYTIFPSFAYYEFLPVNCKNSTSGDLVELADVELGREYELVITNRAGLYRYRVGDVLRVVDFYNSAPQFAFVRRAGVLLSVDTDKTDELELHTAVVNACSLLPQDVFVVDYTSRVELCSHPGHYVVYWELSLPVSDSSVELLKLEECCSMLESSLSVVYLRNRREGSVGAMEIKLLQNGTFDRIVDYVVSNREGSVAQFKVPRCARDPTMIDILESNVVRSIRATHIPLPRL
ncbi:hypothetical protein SELMODRAFT_125904 [Selaginella moellendorffii]|uniref:Uncharacterized protein DFL1L1-1 n=1 Tax=Selaginella moellendorffii TaxID=88036 RepID=D8SVG6_SELML|nr:hypothetical protein SELMODRAFT_125904 [Selaginella moellendorffii]